MYADLIIWKEALKHVGEVKKPLIFIVDDLKEDWWVLEKKNKPLNPREELVEEVYEVSGKPLLMYSLSQFLRASNDILDSNVTDDTIELAKGLRIFEKIKSKHSSHIPIFTATNSKTEPFRIDRLKYVYMFLSNSLNESNLKRIDELNDHKGFLTVYWNDVPSESEIEIVEESWEAQNELSSNIKHSIARN